MLDGFHQAARGSREVYQVVRQQQDHRGFPGLVLQELPELLHVLHQLFLDQYMVQKNQSRWLHS